MSKEINLKEILNKCHKEAIEGFESIHTKDFPVAYTPQALNAMREACNQVIDLCAENAMAFMVSPSMLQQSGIGNISLQFQTYPAVNKQSILATKDQIV